VDTVQDRAYAGHVTVKSNPDINVNSYLPADIALKEDRKVTLRVSSFPVDVMASDPWVDYDLSPLFARLRVKALEDYKAYSGPKSDSGVLTRQPWVVAMGAREGRVGFFLRFRVWYGIVGWDYTWPLMVDTTNNTLSPAADFVGVCASGMRAEPPEYTYVPSPTGAGFAVIYMGKVDLYR
jgi:hypothetical protein